VNGGWGTVGSSRWVGKFQNKEKLCVWGVGGRDKIKFPTKLRSGRKSIEKGAGRK